MKDAKQYIAVDLGAESGRVMLGTVSADKVGLEEVHRFVTGGTEENDSLRWDFARLLSEVKAGIGKAVKQADGEVCGIGVDTWAVDYGLLDENGQLIENPYHYRDKRTNDMMDKAATIMPRRQIYEHTGLQFMQFNTLYQLMAAAAEEPEVLAKARQLIFIPDLFSYFLCGEAFGEYTVTSTTQLMDMRTGEWSKEMFDTFGLALDIMPSIVRPGTIVGKLTRQVAAEIGCGTIDVIATGSHDTASAIAAVPADDSTNWAYFSSGTWSLLGVEVPKAIINDKAYACPFTNEGGVENTIRFLKNVMGLWILQQCRKRWQEEGVDLSYAEWTDMAEAAEAFVAYINPDNDIFFAPGDMPTRINQYLQQSGQKTIEDKGQMVRVILESLAFKYRWVLDKIEEVTGDKIDCVHIVGGGSQNGLLCQFTADVVGKKAVAGPVEATALGNLVMQAKATGQIESLAQARRLIRNSFELKEYQPQDSELWDRQYKRIEN